MALRKDDEQVVNTQQTVTGNENIVIGQVSGAINDRRLQIKESAVGSVLVAGDRNTIHVIQQTQEQTRDEPEAQSLTEIGPNPYKGLAAFKEADAARYFGREAQIKRLWQRFQSLYEQSEVPRLLPILGPSGCGKSSLARAGFIPELARNPLPGKEHMRVAVMVPGARPLEALAGVLAKAVTGDPFPAEKTKEFRRVLQEPSETGDYEGLRLITNLIPDIRDTPLVILVDQFEEVYSLCDDTEQRQTFINNLLHAASEPTGEVSVVITLRSDFWSETQRHKQLNRSIGSDDAVNVPAMTDEELRRAIAEPAKQAKHPLDEATIDLLVKDTEGREGALPLLQFALTRIWDGLGKGQTPANTYRNMGGVGGALAGKAQEIYDRLSESEQAIARRVFVGLVQLGEGTRDTRRRVRVDNLIAKQDKTKTVQHVIRQFSSFNARLITLSSADDHEIAEVTHEALFEHWQQLNNWLDSSRDDIRFHRRLEAAAQYWNQQKRANGVLWRAPDLDLLRTYQHKASQDMTELETAFWQASEQAAQRRKRTRRLVTGGLALGFGLTSISTGFALWNVRTANLSNVRVLAQSAATLRASGDTFESLLMALRAQKQFSKNRLTDSNTLNQVRGEFYASLFQKHYELNRFEGHNDTVLDVRFSPGGEILATSSEDSTARLWNLDGRLITTLKGHSDKVLDVRFSPDSKTFATASWDGTAKLWNLDGSLITTLKGHKKWVWDVRFSPDGQTLVTGSEDGTAKLWKLDGSLIATLEGHSGSIGNIRFSPDGQTLATGSKDNTVKLWSLDGSLIATLEGHSDSVWGVVIRFSPDGQTLATGSKDNTVKLWKLDGSLITTLEGHSNVIKAVSFSPDSQTIATASEDGTAKLWNLAGNVITTLTGHSSVVNGVVFGKDGKTLITISWDGTVKLWKFDGSLIATLEGKNSEIWGVRTSPDGKTLATINRDGAIRLWTSDGSLITTLKGHSDEITDVNFSPDGKTLATASEDGTAKLWKIGGSLVTTLKGHSNSVRDAIFSPDGKTLITASEDNTAKLWTSDGHLITTLEGHRDEMIHVDFSSDGKMIVTRSEDGTAKLWTNDGSLITTLKSPPHSLWAVRFSSDGKTLATANQNNTVNLWTGSGSLVATLKGDKHEFFDIRFSPNGKTLATRNQQGTVKLWTSKGRLITSLEGHINSVFDFRFSPDSQTLVTGSRDGTVKLWKLDGSLIDTLESHKDEIRAVFFSPDGKILVTRSRDDVAKLWKVGRGLAPNLEGRINKVFDFRFSPDSKTLVTGSRKGTAKLWTSDGRLITTLEEPNNEIFGDAVFDARFSPDGKILALASEDGRAKLWTSDGSFMAILEGHEDEILRVRFSPDGKTLITASKDGTAKLWPLGLDLLIPYACESMGGYLLSSPNIQPEDKKLCD